MTRTYRFFCVLLLLGLGLLAGGCTKETGKETPRAAVSFR